MVGDTTVAKLSAFLAWWDLEDGDVLRSAIADRLEAEIEELIGEGREAGVWSIEDVARSRGFIEALRWVLNYLPDTVRDHVESLGDDG